MNLNIIMLHAHASGEGFDILSILKETLFHGLKMLPLLFTAYLIIEIVEHRAIDKLRSVLGKKATGVLGGALLGLFPECGFSVASANLYAENFISAGALAAVFIATSDEALPIILSTDAIRKFFLPLLLLKLVLAILAGFTLDFLLSVCKRKSKQKHHHEHHAHAHHSEHVHEVGEHHHCSFCDSNKGIFLSTLKRTLITLLFLLATIFVFNTVMELVGKQRFETVLGSFGYFTPFVSAFIGLIPSCAVSVMFVGLFTEGVISFGALVAGLCAGAGAGVAVLLKNGNEIKKSLMLIAYVWLFSSFAGLVISIFA